MKVLITGADGQLARTLVATAPSRMLIRAVDRARCDITDSSTVEEVFRSFRPEVVINAAAYTSVDAAEDNQELAFRVNAHGAENVARAAESVGASLIHISTDYVFDGRRSTPYPPDAPTSPTSVYGASKLEGEKLVLGAATQVAVVRAGWLYSTTGKNFLVNLLTALRSSQLVSMVRDQVGCPTSAYEFALAIWKMPSHTLQGIYHWANLGSATRYDFATEIARTANEFGLLRREWQIIAVTSADYQSRAKRPPYSVLDASALVTVLGVRPSPWQHALRRDMARGIPALAL